MARRPMGRNTATMERGSFAYDDVHNVFVFLKGLERYARYVAPYDTGGGTTATWIYRLAP